MGFADSVEVGVAVGVGDCWRGAGVLAGAVTMVAVEVRTAVGLVTASDVAGGIGASVG